MASSEGSAFDPAGTHSSYRRLRRRLTAAIGWIALVYLVVGLAWIFGSDRLVASLSDDPVLISFLQSVKGAFYVLATTALLALLLRAVARIVLHAHRLLEQSESTYRALFDGNPTPMWMYDPDGRRLQVANDAAIALYGWSREEFLALNRDDLCVTGDAVAAGRSRQEQHRRKDGSNFLVEAHEACLIDQNGHRLNLVMVRDLTEPERMRDALAASNLELQAMTKRLFSLQEDERRALSRELHDDVGQSITAIKLCTVALKAERDEAARNEAADEIIAIADETVGKLRNLATLLRPPQFDALGLEAALRWQADRLFRSAGPELHMDIGHLPRRPSDEVGLAGFRIAQESLTNALRHGNAREVSLSLHGEDEGLRLEIRDDGQGFEPNGSRGLGLVTMRERAQLVGGELLIDSRPGAGTRIRAWLPYLVPGAD